MHGGGPEGGLVLSGPVAAERWVAAPSLEGLCLSTGAIRLTPRILLRAAAAVRRLPALLAAASVPRGGA
eukprot:8168273-Lingulodinium_polyedra.AAC.1